MATWGGCADAAAGELRLGFAELAGLVDALARAHDVTIASEHTRIVVSARSRSGMVRSWPVAAPMLAFAGARYTLRLDDAAAHIGARATPAASGSGIRLVLDAGSVSAVRFRLDCEAGLCPPGSAIPDLVWTAPRVSADILLRSEDGHARFALGSLTLSGDLRLDCPAARRQALCPLTRMLASPALPSARARAEATLRRAMAAIDPRQMLQQALALSLPDAEPQSSAGGSLRLVTITAFDASATGVSVSFCTAPDCP